MAECTKTEPQGIYQTLSYEKRKQSIVRTNMTNVLTKLFIWLFARNTLPIVLTV